MYGNIEKGVCMCQLLIFFFINFFFFFKYTIVCMAAIMNAHIIILQIVQRVFNGIFVILSKGETVGPK